MRLSNTYNKYFIIVFFIASFFLAHEVSAYTILYPPDTCVGANNTCDDHLDAPSGGYLNSTSASVTPYGGPASGTICISGNDVSTLCSNFRSNNTGYYGEMYLSGGPGYTHTLFWFTTSCCTTEWTHSADVVTNQPPLPQRYSCNSNNQCVADSDGDYESNDCDNVCAVPPPPPPPPETHLECRNNTCAEVSGSGSDDCSNAGSRCGLCNNNGRINEGEQCDGNDFGGENCQSLGYEGGTLNCRNCTFNTDRCVGGGGGGGGDGGPRIEICGDGRVGAGEQCDLGSGNGACPSDCSPSCQLNSCGGACELPSSPYFSDKVSDLATYGRRLENNGNNSCYAGSAGNPVWSDNNSSVSCVSDTPTTTRLGQWRGRGEKRSSPKGSAVCNTDNNCYGCLFGYSGVTKDNGEPLKYDDLNCTRRYSCAIDNGPYVEVEMKCNGSNGPCEINLGGSATLSWTVTTRYGLSTTCSASGDWSGSKSAGGGSESTGSLNTLKTYSYILNCSNSGASAQDTVNVIVSGSVPNNPGNVFVTQPNYCVSGPAATTEWTYSDPSGSPQSAYQVQIDDQGSFSSPEWDSGKVSCSGCRANSTPQGYLAFNTIYKARVRVWNGYDITSGWTESSSWKTPIHAYPQTNFSFAGAIPGQQNLIPDLPIQFTDQSTCYNNQQNPVTCSSWLWNFDDSTTSTQRNPQHTYSQTNTYNVNLKATDSDGINCSITKPVQVIELNPIWKEVNPGG